MKKIIILKLFILGLTALFNLSVGAQEDVSQELKQGFYRNYGYYWEEASQEVRNEFELEYRERMRLKEQLGHLQPGVDSEVSYAVKKKFYDEFGYNWEEASGSVQTNFLIRYNKEIKELEEQEREEARKRKEEILERKQEKLEEKRERAKKLREARQKVLEKKRKAAEKRRENSQRLQDLKSDLRDRRSRSR